MARQRSRTNGGPGNQPAQRPDTALCWSIPSRLPAIEPVCEQIRERLAQQHLEKLQFRVEVLARECLNNAILHGNGGLANGRVSLAMRIGRKLICLRVADQGAGFNWRQLRRQGLPPPSAIRGRGLMMAHLYAQRVAFNRRGNQVTLWIKR